MSAPEMTVLRRHGELRCGTNCLAESERTRNDLGPDQRESETKVYAPGKMLRGL